MRKTSKNFSSLPEAESSFKSCQHKKTQGEQGLKKRKKKKKLTKEEEIPRYEVIIRVM